MARKAFTTIAAEVGVGSGEIGEIWNRVRSHCFDAEGNVSEAMGFGIFYRKHQAERWFIYDNKVCRVPEREIVAMRPPKRRNDLSYVAALPNYIDIRVVNFPDTSLNTTFRVSAGAVQFAQPVTPTDGLSRNVTFNPIDSNTVNMSFLYEEFPGTPGTPLLGGTVTIHRYRSAWRVTESPAGGIRFIYPTGGSTYLPFAPVAWANLQQCQNDQLNSKLTAWCKYCFMVLTGEA